MEERTVSRSNSSVMLICLDQFSDYDWNGRIYIRSQTKPWSFSGILELFEKMETFYDELDFPRASTSCRSFRTLPEQKKRGCGEEWTAVWSEERMKEQRGDLATFLVRIQCRQRSSWQGQATWIEQDKTETFHSILELLKKITDIRVLEKN